MGVRMNAAVSTAFLLFAGMGWSADRIVPIEQEPQHRLKFQNRHVRFFDVLLPPGYNSMWHSHLYDGVLVNIEAAETRAQDLGTNAGSSMFHAVDMVVK